MRISDDGQTAEVSLVVRRLAVADSRLRPRCGDIEVRQRHIYKALDGTPIDLSEAVTVRATGADDRQIGRQDRLYIAMWARRNLFSGATPQLDEGER